MRQRSAPQMAAGWADLDGEHFELDTVLPEQYHSQSAEWNGEQRLLAAVIVRAVRDYVRRYEDAEAWIHSAADHPYSYEYACCMLHIDPDYIRVKLRRLVRGY